MTTGRDCEILKTAFDWLTLCCSTPSKGTTGDRVPVFIGCDGDRIVSITLSVSMSGTISSVLGQLDQLTKLDLSENHLEGRIPASLGNLTKLTYLDLSHNELSGPIPSNLDNLKGLKYLRLNNNKLNGTLSPSITSLIDSKIAAVHNNCFPNAGRQDPTCVFDKFAKSLPSINNDCENLSLALKKMSFMLPIPKSNCCAWNRQYIKCEANGFVQEVAFGSSGVKGPLPDELFLLTQLRTIRFNNNGIVSPIPPSIGNATNLQRVDLAFNEFFGPIPTELGSLDQLEVLLLNYNNLDGTIPTQLSNLGQLADVNMGYNHFTGQIPVNLIVFQSQFDHNCLSGTILPNQQDCLESYTSFIGRVVGGFFAGLFCVSALAYYVRRVYMRAKEAQRSADAFEYGSTEKLSPASWDSTPAPY
ncbi:hypothetical protein BDR26DRAFT_857671 [Obelidium mucronatum]|nr:hypothetical protein BDR26DRAFT_857671 [Obelidium mucronatum]